VITPIIRWPFELGKEPAELLEAAPERKDSRDVFVLYGQMLYQLLFMPSVRNDPQANQYRLPSESVFPMFT